MRDALSGRSGDGAPESPRRRPGRPRSGRPRLGRPRRPHRPIPPRPTPRRARRRPERAVTADLRAPPPSTTPRITPGRRTRTLPQQPSGREGPARADRHHDPHAPRLQNHPRITFTVRRASRGPPEPLGRSPTAPPVTPCRRTHPRWGGWGSWDGLRWGRVQICCKGAPGRDRPREETRNINVSSRTLRRDPGLCNRFGQPAPPGSSPRGGRRLGGSHDERPGDPAGRDASPPVHSGRPRRPDVHFALESAVPTVVLECEMHVSTRIPPLRRPGPRAGRPVGIVQEPGRIHSGVALGSRGKSRSSSAQSSALTAGVISGRRS